MKYRKKPVVIDAVQYTGKNIKECLDFTNSTAIAVGVKGDDGINTHFNIVIPTLEGNMTTSPNDYIIRGVKGEYYPCKPDIFEATYELAE